MNLKLYDVRWWWAEDVGKMCARYGLFTRATLEEYDTVLSKVENNFPTNGIIYEVAQGIYNHTDRSNISIDDYDDKEEDEIVCVRWIIDVILNEVIRYSPAFEDEEGNLLPDDDFLIASGQILRGDLRGKLKR